MLALMCLVTILATSSAEPQSRGQTTPKNDSILKDVPIPYQTYIRYPNGSYYFSYVTGNGIRREERGSIETKGVPGMEGLSVNGFYSYTNNNVESLQVNYTADDNGFLANSSFRALGNSGASRTSGGQVKPGYPGEPGESATPGQQGQPVTPKQSVAYEEISPSKDSNPEKPPSYYKHRTVK